ncbi:hypothetical protein [Deinococcus humi]|uniref:Uncharacterized protein n=1 Tax=Deinococcus humi TaxID=662880 RepID=A0A7W8JZU3_9DEIO|nr:hypothetical protein [Deinococcus humi]MBB5365873.1 hypothetical protein [Deinococcus humi]GGO38839.1 hypothetical protein GCM10008949_46070 [Deinococcus humi]
MIVETKIVGRRTPFERRPTSLPDGPQTLRSLLTTLVHQEVAAYHERQESVGMLRVLTERDLSDGAAMGRISVAPQERSGTVTVKDATQTALQAYGDGLYYVFVDDEQIEGLDQVVTLKPDSTLLFLRLTALAGG